MFTTKNIIYDCLNILMEGAPKDINIDEFCNKIYKIKGVSKIHDIHFWVLSHGKTVMTAHIDSDDHERVLTNITLLCRKLGISHSTIQLENPKKLEYQINCNNNIHEEILN